MCIGGEKDARFLFCACAISAILNDWSGVDVDHAAAFLMRCKVRLGVGELGERRRRGISLETITGGM